MVNVHLRLYTHLADQPERRELTSVMGGNGTYTARWGWSFIVKKIRKYLPPCDECKARSFADENVAPAKRTWNEKQCTNCTRWETTGSHPLLRFDPKDDNYPEEELDEDGLIGPLQLTFGSMSDAMDHAYDQLISDRWSHGAAEAYLGRHAVSEALKREVEMVANHNRYWTQFISKKLTEKQLVEELGQDTFDTIKLKGMLPVQKPSNWDRQHPLALHIEVIMHLLFLGVWKTLVALSVKWLKRNGMESSFLRYSSGILEKVGKLNLTYCRVMGYKKGKLGAWVSENYLGFARVSQWFYSHFGGTEAEEEFRDPEKPPDKWLVKENKGWLDCRELSTEGNAKELRQRVKEAMEREGGPPPILRGSCGKSGDFQEALVAAIRMIAVIMQDFVDDELLLEMEYRIKVFMTKFDTFDRSIRGEDDKPTWESSYNYLSLFNVPVAAGLLGPLRNVWEGGQLGEGYLRNVKGEVNQGLRPGWDEALLKRLYLKKGLANVRENWEQESTVIDDVEEDGESEDEEVSRDRYYRYEDYSSIILEIQRGAPLSLLRLKNGKYGCVISTTQLVEVEVDVGQCQEINGMYYFHWEVKEKKKYLGRLSDVDIEYPVLLLPMLNSVGTTDEGDIGLYTGINDRWMKLDVEGEFVLY